LLLCWFCAIDIVFSLEPKSKDLGSNRSRYHALRQGGTTGYITAKKVFVLWRFLTSRDAKRGHESCFSALSKVKDFKEK